MSKFKYISGDFAAEYATLLKGLKEAQQSLDESYERSVRKLLAMETARLEETVPVPFETGVLVKTGEGRVGKVLACPVDIDVFADESYAGVQYGPGRYYNLADSNDEEVVTCEGMIRKVTVEIVPNEFEKDWGHDKIIQTYWPDELTEIL